MAKVERDIPIACILDCIAEEKRIRSVIEEETWKKYNKKVANLEIYGWRIDKLYNFLMGV